VVEGEQKDEEEDLWVSQGFPFSGLGVEGIDNY